MSSHLQGGGYIVFGADPIALALVLVLALALASHFLICTISCDPVVGILSNFHGYIIGT